MDMLKKSLNRFPAIALAVLAFGLAAYGQDKKPQAPAKPAAKPAANAPAKKSVAERDYYFISDDLIRNKDGTITWFYVTNHVGATYLKKSLDKMKIQGLKTDTRERRAFQVAYESKLDRSNLNTPVRPTDESDENVLMLTMHPAYKDIVEEFLKRFDVPKPQVYIKAKVVEVTLDSNLEYGVSMFFDRGGGDPDGDEIGGGNPNSFFRAFRSQQRPTSFSGNVLSPDNTGLTMVFDAFGLDETTFAATIEALQERGAANILSEPSIVATQGHLATLVTGQETPIFEIKVTGASETIATTFKDTGIRLDFTPLHVGDEFVKLRVRTEVSSITGFLEATGVGTTVQNPIIAQRNSETVVTVRDGMTLVIGGLYAVSEIEERSGVPILSDIPVLRFLFSRTQKNKVKSELDFFITPHILKHRLNKTVFMPPMERRRLEALKRKDDARSLREEKERKIDERDSPTAAEEESG
ncbi:MAG: type II secretion system protein GspD [Planctomycetota bacterium]|jgi:type II secretory pathway component GspD/PulD (secretin)